MNQQQGITEYKEIQPNQQGKVDFLALYNFLQIKTKPTIWFYRLVENYGFVEQKDFFPKMGNIQVGRPQQNYDLSIGMAKEVCMLAKGDIGKKVRQYYIDLEDNFKKPQNITIGDETSKFFNNLLDEVSKYSPTARLTIAAQISDKVYGVKLPYHALPLVTEARKSATDIGLELGLTPNAVGRLITRLDLKKPPFVEWRLSVAKYTNKEVRMGYYSLEAQRKIAEAHQKDINKPNNEAKSTNL